VAGLGWWAQAQWVDRQRKLWREHDAKLAAVWRDDAPPAGDNVIVLPDVREARARKAPVIVLPEAPRVPQP
jgi:hypothetical protein